MELIGCFGVDKLCCIPKQRCVECIALFEGQRLGGNVNRMLKNILSGIGSVLVIAPATGYSHYRNDACGRSDIEALRADVRSIGGDFRKAVAKGQSVVEAEKVRS